MNPETFLAHYAVNSNSPYGQRIVSAGQPRDTRATTHTSALAFFFSACNRKPGAVAAHSDDLLCRLDFSRAILDLQSPSD
jgi:hypothetical protein